jgi:hypothetical protein
MASIPLYRFFYSQISCCCYGISFGCICFCTASFAAFVQLRLPLVASAAAAAIALIPLHLLLLASSAAAAIAFDWLRLLW